MRNSEENSLTVGGLDWVAILVYTALVLMGWINIYAAVYDETHSSIFDISQRYGMQLIWIGVSAFIAISILLIDDKYYHILAYPLYWFSILVLIGVLLFGKEVHGAKSWLFGIQPSEFVKFTVALALARYMSSYSFDIHNLKHLLHVGILLGLPILIVMLQNDNKERAIKYFEDYLTYHGNPSEAHLFVGISFMENKLYEDAWQHFMLVLENDRGKAEKEKQNAVYAYLSYCALMQSNYREFLSYLKIACEKAPEALEYTIGQFIPEEVEAKDFYNYVVNHSDWFMRFNSDGASC